MFHDNDLSVDDVDDDGLYVLSFCNAVLVDRYCFYVILIHFYHYYAKYNHLFQNDYYYCCYYFQTSNDECYISIDHLILQIHHYDYCYVNVELDFALVMLLRCPHLLYPLYFLSCYVYLLSL
ncbi:hypothetical protein BDC45DRAFT_495867 [Circinella umbellata]|nr:hypothetical protein BDC45DRAFT_495867 [Circinella umbellata]